MRGVVTQGTGGQWHVRLADGRTTIAALRGRVKHAGVVKLAVGDEVEIEPDAGGGVSSIVEILPRRSRLARRSPGNAHQERIVVANVDQVLVVFAAARPEPNEKMLDRFLVIAGSNELTARVIINKVDLTSEREARERFRPYEMLGYPLHLTSAVTGAGLEGLRGILEGRVSALSGPSGVGKSSLLNAMYPGVNLRVGAISDSVNKGRHTTVGAHMHPLPDGGFVVDTPGLREVGLWGIDSRDVDRCFPELAAVLEDCRFGDCRHLAEPDCAVRAAVAEGRISRSRYESYVKLREELAEAERERQ
jgi:ribosome biogenesis GTPase